jgi:hypothetical protein
MAFYLCQNFVPVIQGGVKINLVRAAGLRVNQP